MTEPRKGFEVRDDLQSRYTEYYTGAESAWRRTTAVDKAAKVTALCSGVPHETILEIGCGDGAILERLDALGFGKELHGLEISSSALEQLRQKTIPSLQSSAEFDGYTVPFEDKRFDLVIMSHVLEHVEFPRRLLYEAARVARYVFIEVPLEDNLLMRTDYRENAHGHINFYSWVSIRRLVQSSGFDVVHQRVRNASWPVYKHTYGAKGMLVYLPKEVAVALAPRLASKLITYHCGLLCRPV